MKITTMSRKPKKVKLDLSGPQLEVLESTEAFNLFMSGAGGGKTHAMGLGSADFILNYTNVIGLIAANTHEQLNKSTLKRIFEVWRNEFGWQKGVDYVCDIKPPKQFKKMHIELKEYHNTITFNNGGLIFVASLDNYKAIDGQEIGWAMLDETKDTKEEAISETISWRLRQTGMWLDYEGQVHTQYTPGIKLKGYNPLYIFTSPAKEQWLNEMFGLVEHYDEIEKKIFSKTEFFSVKKEGRCVVIGSAFHNEANLPPGFIESRLQQYKGNKHLVDTLIYGSPIAKVGGEFYHQFERSVHVGNFPYVPGESFHITSDQNIHPYFTLLVAQIFTREGKWVVRFIREFCLTNPRNNMEDTCASFAAHYEEQLNGPNFAGLFYYGDASGKKTQTVMSGTIRHHYQQLEVSLYRYLNENSNRVGMNNPSVIKRRDFFNKILAGGYDIVIEIDFSCTNFIADLDFLKEGPDGKKFKQKVKDKDTKVTYEKYGHTSDAADYLIIQVFEELYNNFQ